MATIRGVFLWLSLLACLETTLCSPTTPSHASYLPTSTGNSSIHYHFQAKEKPTEHHQDYSPKEEPWTTGENIYNGLTRFKTMASSTLKSRQTETFEESVSMNNTSSRPILDDADVLDSSDEPTERDFTEVTLNPFKKMTETWSDCDQFLNFFHYKGTFFLHNSGSNTDSGAGAFTSSCWFTITVPASLSLKTRVECVATQRHPCCFYSTGDYYVRHDGYGAAPEDTRVISPDPFQIILLDHSYIRPAHVNVSFATFPLLSTCRWSLQYISATHGRWLDRVSLALTLCCELFF